MPEATSARTTSSGDSMMTNYQINDAALKSLRTGRLPGRAQNLSNNSNKSGGNNNNNSNHNNPPLGRTSPTNHPQDMSRYSERSSTTSSSWRGWLGRSRRIHGSAASVASSITLTEFGSGVFSEDFEISERSLDIHQLDSQQRMPLPPVTDSQPQLPQRHASVTAGQSSSLLSTTTSASGPSVQPPSRGPPVILRSSDLSPRQPDRKMSLPTVVSGEATPERISLPNVGDLPFGRSDTKDSVPQFPSRKLSSVASHKFPDWPMLFQEAMSESLAARRIGTTVYTDTFSGHEAITQMMEAHMVETRQEGVEVGQALLNDGVVASLGEIEPTKLPFGDSSEAIYVLKPAPLPPPPPSSVLVPSPSLLSVRRKTHTSICIEEESPLQEETAKQIDVPPVMMKR